MLSALLSSNMVPLLILLTICISHVSSLSIGILRRQKPPPSNLTSCGFWSHASVQSGDKIYIYGAEGLRNDSGILDSPQFFSLDLSRNFDIDEPKLLPISTLSRGGPPDVVNSTLWLDQIRNRILLYGGAFRKTSGDVDTLPQAIWGYDLIQDSWSAVTAKGDPVSRATFGASTFVNDIGYYRGGQQDAHTTPGYPEPADFRLLAGMRTFNMTSGEFDSDNSTLQVYGDPVSLGYRQGALVPIELAGRDYLISYAGGGRRGTGLKLNNVYIYDIERQEWFQQPTAGDIPTNVRGVCAVAAYALDGSSVNIYNYGGVVYDNNAGRFTQSQQMWILSIPAFQWVFVDRSDALQPRGLQDHTCHLQGTNMLVVGGRDFSSQCDSNPVKVFNISTLKWEPKYSAFPATYRLPYEVFAIIGGDSMGNSKWVDKPFITPTDTNSPFYKFGQATVSPSPTLDVPPPSGPNPTNRDGVIAGATIGSIAGVSILLAVISILRRKKRKESDGREKGQENFHNEVFAGIDPNTQPPTDDIRDPPPSPPSPESTRRFWASLRRAPSNTMPSIPRRPMERRRDQLSVLDTTAGSIMDRNSVLKDSPRSPPWEYPRGTRHVFQGLAELPAGSMSSDEVLPISHMDTDLTGSDIVLAELEPRHKRRIRDITVEPEA
ncbi:hypothetical protein TWF569_009913 [Orbilia oligospora]|nr:hypothetical protein TWF706_011930 [Orbilia oligospora]KAF3135576.1 hypothetical protein TWF569_009913 [Orbilia oligospora]KAF3142538.1 hypothetical protein TWF594_005435 [Orbilia oligospora]